MFLALEHYLEEFLAHASAVPSMTTGTLVEC